MYETLFERSQIMRKTIKGLAAPLPLANVDTDVIMPKRFLITITREGLADGTFADLRFRAPTGSIDIVGSDFADNFLLDDSAVVAAAILDAAFPAVRGVRTPLQRPPHLPRDP